MKTKIIIENQLNDYINSQIQEELQENNFFDLTRLEQIVNVDENKIEIKYNLYIKDSIYKDFVMSFSINGDYKSKNFGSITHFACEFCYPDKYLCPHLVALINLINNHYFKEIKYDDDLIALINDEYKKYLLKEQERAQKMANDKLNILIAKIKEQETLSSSEKLSLEPIIKFDQRKISLSLKIGDKKKYVVKDIDELIYAIATKRVIAYSKTFQTDHNIDSFDERSKKLIDLVSLTSLSINNVYSTRRTLDINLIFLDKLIEIYTHSYITIDNLDGPKLYYVKGEPYKIKLGIINNMLVFPELDDCCYFEGRKYNYIGLGNELYYIDEEQDIKVLQKFIFENNGYFDFSLIKDNFSKEIYSRFYDIIDADETFKKENPLKELKVESYFDYKNDEILLEDKYFVDGALTSIEDVKNIINISKCLTKYQSIINSLGFVNQKIDTIEKVTFFLKADLSELKKYSDVYLSDNISKLRIKKFSKPTVRLSYNLGMLDVAFKDLNYSSDELQKIISSIKRKNKYIKLKDNTILELDNDSVQFLNTIEEFDLDTKKLNEVQERPLYQSLKVISEEDSIVKIETDEHLKAMINEIKDYKNSSFSITGSLNDVMRSYQKEAYKWIKTLIKYNFSGIIADDMGLGKTLEMISVIKDDESLIPSLIVCPKSLIYNWYNEFRKWSPNDVVIPIDGINSSRKGIINNISDNKKVIYITSYDSLRNDLNLYDGKSFKFMILDEAQYIKNHNTLKAQSVKQIKAINRFVLTGTPIENSVMDLWSIFDFLMPNYLYKYSEFRSTYEKNVIMKEESTVNRLIKKITPFVLRRTKEDVLKSLPEKIVNIYYAKMQDDQRKIYEAELLKVRNSIKTKTSKIDILAALTRLRQVCVDPALYIDSYTGSNCKMELLRDLLEGFISNNHKVLIFSQFTAGFESLQNMLKEMNIAYFTLTGKTSANDRVEMAEAFNKDSKEKVFICSLKAGGTGLNLVGADIVIHLDPWWNVAAENQATDRAHRIGQKNVVQVIKIICQDSIEQKVIELQDAKRDIANMLISSNDENLNKLSDKDLKYILG